MRALKIAASVGLVAIGLLLMAWQWGAVDETMHWLGGVLDGVRLW